MALVDGNLGTAIYRAQKMVNDAFKEHEKHVTEIIVQNHYLLEDSARLYEENARLRELVRIMHGELVSCEDNGYVCGGHKFDERVRELGIKF